MEKKVAGKKIIYVGGVPRSGSTWVGNVIGKSSAVRYYHEPFHPTRGNQHNPIKQFFQYIPEKAINFDQQKELDIYFEKLMSYKVPKLYDVNDFRNGRKASVLFHPISSIHSKLWKQIPLIKDPPSLLMAEWIARNYNAEMLLIVRHPAAFVNSARKASWYFGMETFLKQELLMNDYLSSFKEELEEDTKKTPEGSFSISNSLLFWRIMHHVIHEYALKHPDWLFLKHEELSREPLELFHVLFDKLGLHFSKKVQRYNEENSMHKGNKQSRLKRDSKSLIKQWEQNLSAKELAQTCHSF